MLTIIFWVLITLLIIFTGLLFNQKRILIKNEIELAKNDTAINLSQIQSHFLYNSLSTIKQLCVTDSVEARIAIEEFSDYLHANMDSLSTKNLIPLLEEIKHVKFYLCIEKRKLGDDLNIIYDLKETDFKVPSLSIQPIVENAVQNGIREKEDGGTVKITSSQDSCNWVIQIIDDGVGFVTTDIFSNNHRHIGIRNVRKRLETMCNGEIEISSNKGVGTVATIRIPKDYISHPDF